MEVETSQSKRETALSLAPSREAAERRREYLPQSETVHKQDSPGRLPILLEIRGPSSHFLPQLAPPADTSSEQESVETRQEELPGLPELSRFQAESIAIKLRSGGRGDLANKLDHCHTTYWVQRCEMCRRVESYPNRCEQIYCPMCQPRLRRKRLESVAWWAARLKWPKHLVLTMRNTERLTTATLAGIKVNLAKLRRSKAARGWKGGLWSLEVTNRGHGWHVHLHLLVDAQWIYKARIQTRWAKLLGQDNAIVHVGSRPGTDHRREVSKYVVKGSQLAKWRAGEVVEAVEAIGRQKTFGTFGTLYKVRAEHRDWHDHLAEARATCSCGGTLFKYFSAAEWEWEMIQAERAPPARVVRQETEPDFQFQP